MYSIRSRKHNDGKRYRHHVSADCNTVASIDSSSSESRSGLNRYYRQAWEELHEASQLGHRRHDREAPKDGSELVVSDVYPAAHPGRDKRRHHHHHHHREPRYPPVVHAPRAHHNHKPRFWRTYN